MCPIKSRSNEIKTDTACFCWLILLWNKFKSVRVYGGVHGRGLFWVKKCCHSTKAANSISHSHTFLSPLALGPLCPSLFPPSEASFALDDFHVEVSPPLSHNKVNIYSSVNSTLLSLWTVVFPLFPTNYWGTSWGQIIQSGLFFREGFNS